MVLFSLYAILIYFCILREENDVDEILGQHLFVTVPHLEKPMIKAAIESGTLRGTDTSELKSRLREIEEEEEKQSKVKGKIVQKV